MNRITSFQRPGTLDEAARMLNAEGAVPLGGGARIVPDTPEQVHTLVDLQDLKLRSVERYEGALLLGAGLRLEELVVRRDCDGLFADAALSTAPSLNLRNQMTIGGEAAWRSPTADIQEMQVALLAADALVLRHNEEPMTISAYLNLEQRTGIITALEIPKVKNRRRRFAVIEAARGGRPELALAMSATPVKGKLTECHVALGVPGRVAERLVDIELALEKGDIGKLEEAFPLLDGDRQGVWRHWTMVLIKRFHAEMTGEAGHV